MENLSQWNYSYEQTVVIKITLILLISAAGLIALAMCKQVLNQNKAKREQERQQIVEEIALLKKDTKDYLYKGYLEMSEKERLIQKQTLKTINMYEARKILSRLEKLSASVPAS